MFCLMEHNLNKIKRLLSTSNSKVIFIDCKLTPILQNVLQENNFNKIFIINKNALQILLHHWILLTNMAPKDLGLQIPYILHLTQRALSKHTLTEN